jgi:hypothetical protein
VAEFYPVRRFIVIRRFAWLALLATAVPAAAQPKDVPITRLTIRPAAAPSPALKYQFLPDLKDQTPGNAALLYYRAYSPEWLSHRRQTDWWEKLDKWREMPLTDLPLKELKWLETYRPLQEIDRGGRPPGALRLGANGPGAARRHLAALTGHPGVP